MSNKGRLHSKICYRCGQFAPTKEHVPPKCFFPEQHIDQKDYRVNLITVRSCEEHNLKKSDDDFYLLFVIVSHFKNREVASKLFSSVVIPAFKERPGLKSFIEKRYPIAVNGLPSVAVQVDRERFDQEIINIVHALFFHHFRNIWKKEIIVISPDLYAFSTPAANKVNHQNRGIDQVVEHLLRDAPTLGNNKEIFQYKFYYDENQQALAFRMVFYEGFVVLAVSFPD